MGKAIGGGLPLGAFGGRREIMDLVDPEIDPMTQMRHASTLGGTPACLAAGLAQVRRLTPETHEHLSALGERLRGGVREVATRLDVPLQVTGVSQMFGFHWTPQPVVDFATAMTSDKSVMSQLSLAMLNEGYLMFKSALGTVSAPMTDEDIDGFVACLERVVRESGLAG
jgi:glutamate-1-semialdehyde 2,1-aminomutase